MKFFGELPMLEIESEQKGISKNDLAGTADSVHRGLGAESYSVNPTRTVIFEVPRIHI
jgi:hypothetical protein